MFNHGEKDRDMQRQRHVDKSIAIAIDSSNRQSAIAIAIGNSIEQPMTICTYLFKKQG